jgi:hypothetical protein
MLGCVKVFSVRLVEQSGVGTRIAVTADVAEK